MTTVQAYKESIYKEIDKLTEKTRQLDEKTIRWKPSETEWSILEILCHVEEMIHFWMHDLANVVKHPGIEWGRGMDHSDRLAAVEHANRRSIDEVLQGLQAARQEAEQILSTLSYDDLNVESPHRNAKFGLKPMTFLMDHFMVEHLSSHTSQLERNLTKLSNQLNF